MRLTKRQQDILYLLYRFRFLTSSHIQQFLNHKNHHRIHTWLTSLSANAYIHRFYTPQTLEERSKPAIYCLATKATTILKQNNKTDRIILRGIYREKYRSKRFQNHCFLLAELHFLIQQKAKTEQKTCKFFTKVDLVHYPYFPKPLPDAYYVLQDAKEPTRYFVEIIDDGTPRFVLRKRIQQYVTYFENGEWQAYTKQPFPTVIFICPHKKLQKYLSSFISKTLAENMIAIAFSITTREEIAYNTLG